MPKIQMRRDTAANWSSVNPVLASGEWAVETDTTKSKVGDGVTHYNDLDYIREEDNEWVKPSEWIDIRSGALPNSVYFLVGHSADYSTYPTFDIKVWISNSGTYDVVVDGIKKATTATSTVTTLNWQQLALVSGYDVTYPSSLRTHVIRITPSLSTNSITSIETVADTVNGSLWIHSTLDYACKYKLGTTTQDRMPVLEAITCSGDALLTHTLDNFVGRLKSLVTIPKIDLDNTDGQINYSFYSCQKLRKVHLMNVNNITPAIWNLDPFSSCNSLKNVIFENSLTHIAMFQYIGKLKKLPYGNSFNNTRDKNVVLVGVSSVEDTIIDVSEATSCTRLLANGTSGNRQNGIKSITVSSEAPLSNNTSPQVNANYTGLDRHALRRLFKSLPYNNGYNVTGNPNIIDGIASGFSATDTITSTLSFPNSYAAKNMSWQVKFTTGSSLGNSGSRFLGMYFRNISDAVGCEPSGHPFWKLNGSIVEVTTSDVTLEVLTTYFMSGYIKNGVAHLLLGTTEDNQVEIASLELPELTFSTPRKLFIGTTTIPNVPFKGSIDLNHTWVKIDDVPWFIGKAAMTKTCSIVGCTGTSSLTQEDKNIALNKRWELTLS